MVVWDELRLADGTTLYDAPGGSGFYSTLGARMAVSGKPTPHPDRVGCLVLADRDFPDSIAEALKKWDTALLIKRDASRLSTRGLLQYHGVNFKERVFAYTTTLLQPTPADLQGSPLLRSKAFHFLASPDDLEKFVSQLTELRTGPGDSTPTSVAVGTRAILQQFHQPKCALLTANLVDVYSPNHIEFLATFLPVDETRLDFDHTTIRDYALRLLESGVGKDGKGAVVIRCGKYGSLVVSRWYPARWFPPFHHSSSDKVVDATGAGNAFLGGLAVAFGEAADLTEATAVGSVVASCVIEQIGVPQMTDLDGNEMWNGESFLSRVQQYDIIPGL